MNLGIARRKYLQHLLDTRNLKASTIEYYSYDLDHALEFMEGRDISRSEDVTQKDLESYLSAQQEKGNSKGAIVRRLLVLRNLLTWLRREKGVKIQDPFQDFDMPSRSGETSNREAPTKDTIRAITGDSLVDLRDRAILLLMRGAQANGREVAAMRRDHYEDGAARIGDQTVRLRKPLREAIDRYVKAREDRVPAGRRTDAMWVSVSPRSFGRPMEPSAIWRMARDRKRSVAETSA